MCIYIYVYLYLYISQEKQIAGACIAWNMYILSIMLRCECKCCQKVRVTNYTSIRGKCGCVCGSEQVYLLHLVEVRI